MLSLERFDFNCLHYQFESIGPCELSLFILCNTCIMSSAYFNINNSFVLDRDSA
jgi:hypothetical protein